MTRGKLRRTWTGVEDLDESGYLIHELTCGHWVRGKKTKDGSILIWQRCKTCELARDVMADELEPFRKWIDAATKLIAWAWRHG